MFDFIKNLFRHKAKSFEEFVEAMNREGCMEMVAEPCSVAKGGVESAAVDVTADCQYTLECAATTPRGRKVVYRKCLFKLIGGELRFIGAEEFRDATIRLFLRGEQKVNELRTMLPHISVDLIDPNGRPVDDAMFKKIRQVAAIYKVSI